VTNIEEYQDCLITIRRKFEHKYRPSVNESS